MKKDKWKMKDLIEEIEDMKWTKDSYWVAHHEFIDGYNKALFKVLILLKSTL